jgi:hypothetical protein
MKDSRFTGEYQVVGHEPLTEQDREILKKARQKSNPGPGGEHA